MEFLTNISQLDGSSAPRLTQIVREWAEMYDVVHTMEKVRPKTGPRKDRNPAQGSGAPLEKSGVTWVCLIPVDYNTFTGANADDPVHWIPNSGLGSVVERH